MTAAVVNVQQEQLGCLRVSNNYLRNGTGYNNNNSSNKNTQQHIKHEGEIFTLALSELLIWQQCITSIVSCLQPNHAR